MGTLEWSMLAIYVATCFNVGFAYMLHSAVAENRREIERQRAAAAVLYAEATECFNAATRRAEALKEAIDLVNYGARDEAIEVLREAGVPVKTN